jgi:hypothetical protein
LVAPTNDALHKLKPCRRQFPLTSDAGKSLFQIPFTMFISGCTCFGRV